MPSPTSSRALSGCARLSPTGSARWRPPRSWSPMTVIRPRGNRTIAPTSTTGGRRMRTPTASGTSATPPRASRTRMRPGSARSPTAPPRPRMIPPIPPILLIPPPVRPVPRPPPIALVRTPPPPRLLLRPMMPPARWAIPQTPGSPSSLRWSCRCPPRAVLPAGPPCLRARASAPLTRPWPQP